MKNNEPLKQQGQEPEYDSKEISRDVQIREDQTIIQNDINVKLTPEQTVNRFNRVAVQVEQLLKSYDSYADKIQETLEEYPEAMTVLHTIDEGQKGNTDAEKLPERGQLVDIVNAQDFDRYHKLQEMNKQMGSFKDNIRDGVEDLERLEKAASKMSQDHGLEMQSSVEEVKEKVKGYGIDL